MARWYCMYVTVTQSRSWLPDPVGGIVWFGYGNPAMTTYVPLYAGITDLPEDYKTDGRTTGFSRRSAWWAFNRVATLAAQRWGDMREDVAEVRDPLQEKFLAAQAGDRRDGRRAARRRPGQGPGLPDRNRRATPATRRPRPTGTWAICSGPSTTRSGESNGNPAFLSGGPIGMDRVPNGLIVFIAFIVYFRPFNLGGSPWNSCGPRGRGASASSRGWRK